MSPQSPRGSVRMSWVDVFATGPLSGNPLAVVLDADGWDDARMQAVAAELGLSETVFVVAPSAPPATARLRIFTPTTELPMAGHPVVGAAWVLHHEGRITGRAALETGVGPLEVRVEDQVATMTQARPEMGAEVDAAEVAAACGVTPAPAPAARIWSTGIPQLMLPVGSEDEVAAARPDGRALAALGRRDGWLGVSVFAAGAGEDGRVTARVRHFAPPAGVLEDPVTGSAAGALGACLAHAGYGAGGSLEMIVRQGQEMGRPGEVAVRVRAQGGVPERVRVGGMVLPVLRGRFVPEAP